MGVLTGVARLAATNLSTVNIVFLVVAVYMIRLRRMGSWKVHILLFAGQSKAPEAPARLKVTPVKAVWTCPILPVVKKLTKREGEVRGLCSGLASERCEGVINQADVVQTRQC